MEVVENEFKNYRRRKRTLKREKSFGDMFRSPLMFVLKREDGGRQISKEPEKKIYPMSPVSGFVGDKSNGDCEILTPSDEIDISIESSNFRAKFLNYCLCLVCAAFWATLYKIAIELQFGIVFLMFSALGGIYFNTRIGPKKSKEVSAYSVFNKNCESIDGTLKLEQFERELGKA